MSGSKVLFTGCSLTYGQGLDNEVNDPNLWCNQLANDVFPEATIVNRSKKGANNEWIFLETMAALTKDEFDTVFVEWTAIPRYNIDVGLELYSTQTLLSDNSIDLNLNSESFDASWLKKLGDNLRMLHHDHWDILKLIKYINVLKKLQPQNLYFVNGMLPWIDGYFEKKDINQPSQLTDYEQHLLNVETRNDKEIFDLYDMIHLQYNEYGGIHKENWINLYNSLVNTQVDIISQEDLHPGYKSQDVFTEMIKHGISS